MSAYASTKKCKRLNARAWLNIVRDHENSGLKIKEFCEINQVSPSALQNWKCKFKKQQHDAVPAINFAPVRVNDKSKPISNGEIKIELRSRIKIIVPNNFEDEQLLRLINLLQ
jgi:hypothetical protein